MKLKEVSDLSFSDRNDALCGRNTLKMSNVDSLLHTNGVQFYMLIIEQVIVSFPKALLVPL